MRNSYKQSFCRSAKGVFPELWVASCDPWWGRLNISRRRLISKKSIKLLVFFQQGERPLIDRQFAEQAPIRAVLAETHERLFFP